MQATQPITKLLIRLWHHISPRRRRHFSMLLILMIFASFAEIVSIGAVLPFLAVLTDPGRVFVHPSAQIFIQSMGITKAEQLLLPLTIGFALAAILAGTMRLLLLWISNRLSFTVGADLSLNVYRSTLYQPYAVHVGRNSSEVIDGIYGKAIGVIYYIIVPVLTLTSSAILMCAILVAMFSVDPFVALTAFGGFGAIYALIILITRRQLLLDSQRVARESTQVIKCLQEGLGGIRDVLIDGSQAAYCQVFRTADISLRRAQGNNLFISQSPRYGMEALGILLISGLAYTLALRSGGFSTAVPILGALALGAQRLLPVLQQMYASWVSIQGGRIQLQDTLAFLDQPIPDYAAQSAAKPLPYEQSICLKQLSFRYSPHTHYVLENINLIIEPGSCVGFIGKTGSGKSTLLDIIMGLLSPTNGMIEIDGQAITENNQRAWQAHIAHVPQAIFLSDSTIEENIAFGVSKELIDRKRVREAASLAQLADAIETWPKQYETSVGEQGIRLSGGQRQRIGIARALYKQADVIIFDEATSALDNETEQAVMHAIASLSKNITILIIAHRLTTLKNCSKIVELSGRGIKRVGTYAEIVN